MTRSNRPTPRFPSVAAYLMSLYEPPKFFFNNGDLLKICRATGLSQEAVRGGLRAFGYVLEDNWNGIKIWKLPK